MNQENTSVRLYHGELVVKRFTNFSKKHDDAAKHHRTAGCQWHRKGHPAIAGWPEDARVSDGWLIRTELLIN